MPTQKASGLNEWGHTADVWEAMPTNRRWRIRNPEKNKAARRRYNAKHRDRKTETQREYRLKNREQCALHNKSKLAVYHAKAEVARAERRCREIEQGAIYEAARPAHMAAANQALRDPAAIMRLIQNELPSFLSQDERDEVTQTVLLAALEGDYPITELVQNIRAQISAYRKANNPFRDCSIYETVGGTASVAIIDTIASDDFHF